MNILAIDTSGKSASCAYLRDGKLMGELFINIGNTHSQTILPMIKDLLKSIDEDLSSVNFFAVTAGPGSFTGLRIGLATVKGLAFSGNIPVIPLSTLESLAMGVTYYSGLIIPALDARRGQVYTGFYRFVGGKLSCLLEPSTLEIKSLGEKLTQYSEDTAPILVGDGAKLVHQTLFDSLTTIVAPENLLYPRSSSVGILASESLNLQIPPDELVPIYLRIPQAQRELEEKQTE